MKITRLEAITMRTPTVTGNIADGAHDNVIVRVHTDEGIVGIGEVDAPPSVIKAIIEAPTSMLWAKGFDELLIGEDPLQPGRLWEKVYEGNIFAGRRGLGICALGAVDIALYDIAGKALGVPVYQLLGGAVGRPQYQAVDGATRRSVTPYASILPAGKTIAEYRADALFRLGQAVDAGYRAAKLELLYADRGSDATIVEIMGACRELAGDEMDLHLDVGYRWLDAKSALLTLRALEEHNVYFVEAALHTDNVRGYADLARGTRLRLAVGEMLTTRYEFLNFMENGLVDVVQPNVGRVGGLTEALRVGRLAHDRGLLCIPHAWKSGISIAANIHLSAALPNTPYFEFMVSSYDDISQVRRGLVTPEFVMQDGVIELPTAPGLGVELDEDVLAEHSAEMLA